MKYFGYRLVAGNSFRDFNSYPTFEELQNAIFEMTGSVAVRKNEKSNIFYLLPVRNDNAILYRLEGHKVF